MKKCYRCLKTLPVAHCTGIPQRQFMKALLQHSTTPPLHRCSSSGMLKSGNLGAADGRQQRGPLEEEVEVEEVEVEEVEEEEEEECLESYAVPLQH